MGRYIARRLLQAIPLLFLISIIIFLLVQNAADPLESMSGRRQTRSEDRERLRRQLGLDKPLTIQYLYWLIGNDWTMADLDGDGVPETPGDRRGVLRGDFGHSLKTVKGEAVLVVIGSRLPNTLVLMGTAELVILVVSLLVGVYSAVRQYSVLDQVVTAISFVGYSMPIFFIALLVLYLFSVNFRRWGLPSLPSPAAVPPPATSPAILPFLILPVISLSFTSLAGYSRYVRGTMLEVLNQDYIRTARSKGLPRRTIVFLHALKNASLPLVTLIGLDLPLLLGGAVVTERIFAWPGMGRLFLEGIQDGDTPLLMGVMMLISVAVVVFQILTDLVYAWLDPRIRYQ